MVNKLAKGSLGVFGLVLAIVTITLSYVLTKKYDSHAEGTWKDKEYEYIVDGIAYRINANGYNDAKTTVYYNKNAPSAGDLFYSSNFGPMNLLSGLGGSFGFMIAIWGLLWFLTSK